jgi:uncharacterized protein YecE (DUF72 family)
MTTSGTIRAGMGGWTFEPWEGTFYPDKLSKKKQLEYASRAVPTIEVNGTYYSGFTPATYAKWNAETPDDFVFSIKGNRFVTNRKVLAEAGESMKKFFAQGLEELGPKLGPIVWQFAPTKKFEPEDFAAFLALLPPDAEGVPLRHAVEVRHDSFAIPGFVDLARAHNAAVVYAHSADYPAIADPTADFVYARLQQSREDEKTGYSSAELKAWGERIRLWEAGGTPADLPLLSTPPARAPRECFVFFIAGAKVRNPEAAMALIGRLGA